MSTIFFNRKLHEQLTSSTNNQQENCVKLNQELIQVEINNFDFY